MPLLRTRVPEPQLWTPSLVQQLLSNENSPTIHRNAKFMAGEHWQGGDGWIGPRIDGDVATDELIKKGFTSRNIILEIARRHAEGVIGNEPDWGLVPNRVMREDEKPTDEEQRLIDEAESALVDWWDEQGIHEEFAAAVEQSTWARRGTLRMFIPSGLLGEPVDGMVPLPTDVPDLRTALSYIRVESVPYDQGLVYTDPQSRGQVGAVIYEDDTGRRVLEWSWLRSRKPDSPAFLNTVTEGANPTSRTPFELPLGGRLPMHEIRLSRLLINEQLQQIQKALNLSLSVVPRNIVTAGFLERIFLNAQMPGTWELDPETGRRVKFIPAAYTTGAGTTNFLTGQEVTDEVTGKTTLAQPQVQFREPIPVTSTVEAKRSQYEDGLEEAEQVHILIEGAASPRGVSRQEARAGYGRSLRRTQRPAQGTGRWLVMGALAWGEMLMRQPGKYTSKLRSHFDCRLDLGPISPDDQRVAAELVKQDLLSEPTAMVRIGVQDPDAEISRRNGTPRAQLGLKIEQLTALAEGTKVPGATLEGVAEYIGISQKDLDVLTQGTPATPKDAEGNPLPSPQEQAVQANQVAAANGGVPGVPRGRVAP